MLIAVVTLAMGGRLLAQERTPAGETLLRGGVTIAGRLLALGPVMVGNGGSLDVYNSSGELAARLDSAGNLTATGSITAAGVSSDDLVRGFGENTARLIGSLAVPTTTVTGTAVVGTGTIMSGNCSLAQVPTTTRSFCTISTLSNNNIVLTVYQTNNSVATLPATVAWFAWVVEE